MKIKIIKAEFTTVCYKHQNNQGHVYNIPTVLLGSSELTFIKNLPHLLFINILEFHRSKKKLFQGL